MKSSPLRWLLFVIKPSFILGMVYSNVIAVPSFDYFLYYLLIKCA